MKLPRRQFLHLAAGAAALPAASRIARAQTYPTRPVRIDRWLPARRRDRHHCSSDRSVAVGAARPAIHRRQPTGRWQQYRHRGGREMRSRTATRSFWFLRQRDQRDLSTTSLISISSATSRQSQYRRDPIRHGGASIGAGKDSSRVHRLRQGQSGKISMASDGNGTTAACCRASYSR